MRAHDHHLTGQELLLAIDRELSPRQQAEVAAHLSRCEECREKRDHLARTLGRFIASYQESAPPESGSAAYARVRLQSNVREAACEGDASRRARLLLALAPTPRRASLGAAVLVVAMAVALVRLFPFRSLDRAAATIAPDEREALPLASLTPGATLSVRLPDLCSGSAHEPREIPVTVRQAVLHDYGMEGVPPDEYELDYLITPELGGAPDPRNLWPQRYTSRLWNARVKDQLEDLLPQLVCDRQVALETAQHDIALNWIAAYKKYFHTSTPLRRQAGRAIRSRPQERRVLFPFPDHDDAPDCCAG